MAQVTIQKDTAEQARTALRSFLPAAKAWAEMPHEHEARRIYARLLEAVHDLEDALDTPNIRAAQEAS